MDFLKSLLCQNNKPQAQAVSVPSKIGQIGQIGQIGALPLPPVDVNDPNDPRLNLNGMGFGGSGDVNNNHMNISQHIPRASIYLFAFFSCFLLWNPTMFPANFTNYGGNGQLKGSQLGGGIGKGRLLLGEETEEDLLDVVGSEDLEIDVLLHDIDDLSSLDSDEVSVSLTLTQELHVDPAHVNELLERDHAQHRDEIAREDSDSESYLVALDTLDLDS